MNKVVFKFFYILAVAYAVFLIKPGIVWSFVIGCYAGVLLSEIESDFWEDEP